MDPVELYSLPRIYISIFLEHLQWWSHKFSNLALQKVILSILPPYFTKHSTLVILFYLST